MDIENNWNKFCHNETEVFCTLSIHFLADDFVFVARRGKLFMSESFSVSCFFVMVGHGFDDGGGSRSRLCYDKIGYNSLKTVEGKFSRACHIFKFLKD